MDRTHKTAAEASLRFKLGVVVRTHNLEWRDGGGRPGSRPVCLKGGNAALPGDRSTKVQRDTPNQSRVAFDLQPSTLVQTLAILSKETFRGGGVALSVSCSWCEPEDKVGAPAPV